jgi:hypothetical protein
MNSWPKSNDPATPEAEGPRVLCEHKSPSESLLSNAGSRDVIS